MFVDIVIVVVAFAAGLIVGAANSVSVESALKVVEEAEAKAQTVLKNIATSKATVVQTVVTTPAATTV